MSGRVLLPAGLMLLAAIRLSAQPPREDPAVIKGAAVFAKSCSTGYCHGRAGAAGTNAPALAGKNLPLAQIARATTDGVPGTAMPGWKTTLPEDDLRAVITYVARISTGAPLILPPPRTPRVTRPADVQRGRDLFFDATRGAQRCGTCHQADGWGTQVGPDPRGFKGDIRGVAARNVETVRLKSGEAFPALLIFKGSDAVRVYDLSSPLPVLRSFAPADVTITPGSSWTHSAAIANYTDEELAAIPAFLK